ncbi:MAG: LEA type 2 family protein [Treponema sp.]|nr:LEA type 2 family protein [Treponema sp.]
MKSRIFFLPLALAAAFALWSCQSIGSVVQEPSVSLASVDIAGITFTGVDMIVNVDVENPNRFPIPMPNINWELFVNEAPFLQGNVSNDQSIERQQTVTVALPVSFTFEGLYRTFASLVELREAAYNISLGVTFPLPVIADRVFNLDFSGVLPLPQFPTMSLGQMNISRIDFSGIELAWGINVENPNSFPIPFPSLNWNYEVNGVPLLQSSFAGAGHIAAGAAGVALISVSVAYADVLRAVGAGFNAGEVMSSLSLGIDPQEIGFPLPALNGVQGILSVAEAIPVLRMPEISFQGITRRALGLNNLQFDLIWEVMNRNSFALDINEFNYAFTVNNSLWVQGRMEDPPRVAANGRTVIPLNVVIEAPAIVQTLVPIMSAGSNVNYNAVGNMSFLPDLPGLSELNIPLDIRGSSRIRL